MRRPKNFDELLSIAQKTPDVIGAMSSLGYTLKPAGRATGGGNRYQTTTDGGKANDLSAVAFLQNKDGSWWVYDNKSRYGKNGMDAIEAVMSFGGRSFDEAVYLLSGGMPIITEQGQAIPKRVSTVQAPLPEAEDFEFVPPAEAQNKRKNVFAYLTKARGLPPTLVNALLDSGKIYPSVSQTKSGKEQAMCSFRITDTKGEVVGIDNCAASSEFKFKKITRGSNSDYGWNFLFKIDKITPETPMFFCEAPIDAMSLCAIAKAPGVYISMSGLKDRTLEFMAQKLGGKPIICTDSDEAGMNFAKKYSQYESWNVKSLAGDSYGKDWNDMLKKLTEEGANFEAELTREQTAKDESVPEGTLEEEAMAETKEIQNDGITYSPDGKTLIKADPKLVKGEIIIPEGVTSIGKAAFRDCTGLTSITIPDSVASIGSSAFYRCAGLTSITIPDSVTSIGYGEFDYCIGLTSVTIGNGVTSIDEAAFRDCTGLTSITIPDSVTSIGSSAFRDCTGLESVTIGNGVESIGSGAFYNCRGLTSVIIPDSVTSIGREAFWNCRGLTNITIPKGVTSIGYGAFGYCVGLTNITIPNSVTSIGSGAFFACRGLKSVAMPDSVISIGENAFDGCDNLIISRAETKESLTKAPAEAVLQDQTDIPLAHAEAAPAVSSQSTAAVIDKKALEEELGNKVKTLVERYRSQPKAFAEYVAFCSRFNNYSAHNLRLIMAQNPNARLVAPASYFKNGMPDKLGNPQTKEKIYINKGEHALRIWKPYEKTYVRLIQENYRYKTVLLSHLSKDIQERAKAENWPTIQQTEFTLVPVFDIAQTNAPPEVYPKLFGFGGNENRNAEEQFKALKSYSEDVLHCPVTVEDLGGRKASTRGYFSPAENRIVISDMLSGDGKLSTLIHEIGHAELHREQLTSTLKSKVQIELEADLYALLIESKLGIEATDARCAHLGSHHEAYLKEQTEAASAEGKELSLSAETKVMDKVLHKYSEQLPKIEEYLGRQVSIDSQLSAAQSAPQATLQAEPIQSQIAPITSAPKI